MGSLGAMVKGSAERYGQSSKTEVGKLVPEGVEDASLPRHAQRLRLPARRRAAGRNGILRSPRHPGAHGQGQVRPRQFRVDERVASARYSDHQGGPELLGQPAVRRLIDEMTKGRKGHRSLLTRRNVRQESWLCHCERSEAISHAGSRLLRRCAPRNDNVGFILIGALRDARDEEKLFGPLGHLGPSSEVFMIREMIAILDFGSQYIQLIARRVREHNVYSRIFPAGTPAEELSKLPLKGIILSAGPPASTRPTPRDAMSGSSSWACRSWASVTACSSAARCSAPR